MIHVSHLSRRFGELAALDDVSFDVARGEVVGILGVNGAGKTTAMRILTGYLPATSGVARVAGFDVLRESLQARRHIGYLPENVPLYREHRVSEMLEFQARLHKLPRAEMKRRIPAVLERVGIQDRQRALIGNLSRGQRQRVGLAVALLPEPDVLVLDEPTSGLDPIQRLEVRALVRDLASKHTVLVSSHILPEIEAVCPRVIILHQGRVAADGSRQELVARLAQDAHVRFEAVVGHDAEGAARLLRALPGVTQVKLGARTGIHQAFEIRGAGDLREDVGALAAQRGWAVRELSAHAPTLEALFARIALGFTDDAAAAPAPPSAAPSESPSATSNVLLTLATPAVGARAAESASQPVANAAASAPSSSVAAPPAAANAKKTMYNLNPFERAASAKPPSQPGSTAGAPPRAAEERGANGEACP